MRGLFILLLLTACTVDSGKIEIVTTILPLTDMASGVGTDQVNVYQLLPSGADPHSWEPKPSDLARLENADIIIFVGGGIEPWVESIPKDGILIEFAELVGADEHDPHIWLHLDNDKELVEKIAMELSKLDPGNKQMYEINAAAYNMELDELNVMYEQLDCKQDSFIVGGHSAFGYLEDYGFEQISVSGLSPDAEPSSKKIAEILEIIKSERIKSVVFEDFASPKVAQTIAVDTGADVYSLSTGVTGPSFIDVMLENLETMKKVLECDS